MRARFPAPPTGILFDAGGTLVQPNVHRLSPLLAPMTPDRLDAALWRAMQLLDADFGPAAGPPAEWIPRWLAAIAGEARIDPARFLAAWHAEDARAHLWDQPIDGVAGALERLACAGMRLGVVSNADGRVAAALDRAGLGRHFAVIVDSAVVGVAKPDPAIFDAALTPMGLDPATTWYVGDTVSYDVAAAEAAGLTAWVVDHRGLHRHGHPRTVSSLGMLADLALGRVVDA